MFQPDLLNGKRILITGGATGLGRAMAERFLQLGAAVYICGRRADVLQKAREELAGRSAGEIRSFACDVRNREAVEKMAAEIWSSGPLNVIVNNAAGNFIARSEELSPRAWEAVLGIVLQGTLNLTLACGRRWLAAGQHATVLNVSTTYAAAGCGSAYVVPSAVAKAGVLALTASLAVEWGARGIRLNAIAPGPIRTEGAFSRLLPRKDLEEYALGRIPSRRFGTLEEFANLAAFLVSDGCGHINGEVVVMDGGEWLQGASELGYVGQLLSESDWQNLRPKAKPEAGEP